MEINTKTTSYKLPLECPPEIREAGTPIAQIDSQHHWVLGSRVFSNDQGDRK
jgi:hypothetical protein